MQNRPLIVDTDPGIDDAVALLVLSRRRREETRLILASYGNVPLAHTFSNARRLTRLFDWRVPVFPGAAAPLSGASAESADYIHGRDGLAGLADTLPPAPETPLLAGKDGLEAVYGLLCEVGTADYLTLGPLTNLAALARRHPDVWGRIGRVVTMGGGMGLGNVTEYAEFNLHCDAQAAAEVFANAPELWLAPLDITTPAAFSLTEIERITAGDDALHRAFRTLLETNYRNCVGYGEPGSTMHDSTAALLYLSPELFETTRCGVDVDCSPERYGQTTVTSARSNIVLPTKADPRKILDQIAACLLEVGG